VFAAVLGTFNVASAQDTPAQTDVQQMKDRLKQLEDTVRELKGQLEVIEEKKKADSADAAAAAAATPLPETPAKPAEIVPTDDTNGRTAMAIYGFAMLDAGYDFKTSNPNWYDVIRPTRLPSFGGEFAPNGHTYFGVRQSRLGVKTTTPTRFGDLRTIFEFELFGTGADEGKTTFRLRHAYGELGQFGAGQYWTVFGDTDAYPNTFEYWGPNGLVWFRNIQFRWMPLKGRNAVTLALEKPGASADGGIIADRFDFSGIRPHFTIPDFTGNVRFNRDWGHVQISGILRRMGWSDTRTVREVDLSGRAWGAGISASSALNFGEKDIGRFQFTYGRGIQNYMNDAPVDVALKVDLDDLDEFNRPRLRGVPLGVFGMSTFLDHTWNKRFTSSFGYSMVNIDNSNGQAPNAYRRGMYGIANLLYNPVPNVVIGGEFQWGRRENFSDGFASDDFRIQFGFKYNFSKRIEL
jgi:hypothetical protein